MCFVRAFCALKYSVLIVCAASFSAMAASDVFDMSLEELMDVELPVTSASRQAVQLRYLSASTTVISAEDIHYSGVTTIPEILQFVPGVDMRRLDRQRYFVGVRGLLGMYSDRTIILIDGRPAMDPIFSTIHWENLPIQMEDIDRIEVVRGPGGAVWGNAFNGIINIITKNPGQCQGGLFTTTVNEFGDIYNHLRYGQTQGKWSWKVSAGYEDMEDSDAAGAGKYTVGVPALGPIIGVDNFEASDWGRRWKFDSVGEYRADEQTKWSFGVAHSSSQEGSFETLGVLTNGDFLTEYTRAFTRMDHQIDRDTNIYFQWATNYWNTHRPSITDRAAYLENDFEVQLNFKPAEDHSTSVVGNFRWDRMTLDHDSTMNEFVFDRSRYDEYWTGIFLIDRWKVTDHFTAEGQICVNHYNPSGTDWSTRMTALYALDDKDDHILRVSFARAFRTPSVSFRRTSCNYLGIFTNPATDTEMDNEKTYSLEAGYVGRLTENLSLNVDVYYQRMEQLIGYVVGSSVGPSIANVFKNLDGANGYGAETSLTWKHRFGKITAWYAYNGFVTDDFGQTTRSIAPAMNKAGMTTRWDVNKDWTFNTNHVYQEGVGAYGTSAGDIDGFQRLDLTLSRKFAKNKGELMFGVSDVFNQTNDPVYDANNMTAIEMPGRTFFVRLQISF